MSTDIAPNEGKARRKVEKEEEEKRTVKKNFSGPISTPKKLAQNILAALFDCVYVHTNRKCIFPSHPSLPYKQEKKLHSFHFPRPRKFFFIHFLPRKFLHRPIYTRALPTSTPYIPSPSFSSHNTHTQLQAC